MEWFVRDRENLHASDSEKLMKLMEASLTTVNSCNQRMDWGEVMGFDGNINWQRANQTFENSMQSLKAKYDVAVKNILEVCARNMHHKEWVSPTPMSGAELTLRYTV